MSKKNSSRLFGFWHNFRNSESYDIVARVFSDNFPQYRNRYFLAIGLMVIASAATGGSAWMMREVINSILQANDFNKIIYVGLVVIAIFTIKGFATYGHTVTLALVGNQLSASIQKRVFDHLLSLKMEYFDKTTLGEIFTRASLGVVATRQVIEVMVMTVCRDVLTLFFLGLVMFFQEPIISLFVLAIGPLSAMFIRGILVKTRQHAVQQLQSVARSSSLLKEAITGMMMVKTYSLESEMSKRMSDVVDSLRFRNDRIAKLAARTSPIMETLNDQAEYDQPEQRFLAPESRSIHVSISPGNNQIAAMPC